MMTFKKDPLTKALRLFREAIFCSRNHIRFVKSHYLVTIGAFRTETLEWLQLCFSESDQRGG